MQVGSKVSSTWSWSRGGEHTGSVSLACTLNPDDESTLEISFTQSGERVVQFIRLEGISMRFGGWRWYARCPYSGRRCTTLVMPNGGKRFASVKAWRLPYASQNEDIYGRAHRKIAKARERLSRLSKYARRPTKQRHWDKIWEGEETLDEALLRAWSRISRLEARLG